MQKTDVSSDMLFPNPPASYYARMEATLDALPVRRRSFTTGRISRRQFIILIAALSVMLIAGTALAVGLTRMQAMRESGLHKIDTYTGMVKGTVLPSAEIPSNTIDSDAYIPIGVGMNDAQGDWQPMIIEDLDTAATVGAFTVRLENITYHNPGEKRMLLIGMTIEAESPAEYRFAPFLLSINGGESICDNSSRSLAENPSVTPTPAPYEWPYSEDRVLGEGGTMRDIFDLFYTVDENPLRPDTTFTFTSELNGEPFALTYVLTAERFETIRQQTLTALDNYATLLKDVPDNPIPLGAKFAGYIVTEVAFSDHWLYYTVESDPEYWADHPSGRENLPFSKYDDDGFYVAVDGMLSEFEFISAEHDADGHPLSQMFRAYLPYGDALPERSLITVEGAPFYIEWATGKVTLPKDDAEALAWRQQSEALSAKDGEYDSNHLAKPDVPAETFTVKELVYMNRVGLISEIGVILETDEPVSKPFDGRDRQPIVTIADQQLESVAFDYDALDRFSGGTENGGRRVGFLFHGPALRLLPDTFFVTVEWNGSKTRFTMNKSDLIACYGEEDWEQFGKTYSRIFNI